MLTVLVLGLIAASGLLGPVPDLGRQMTPAPSEPSIPVSTASPSPTASTSPGGSPVVTSTPVALRGGLTARAWATVQSGRPNLAGILGGPVLLLPDDEFPIAVASQRVATVVNHGPAVRPTRSTLIVRDVSTGAPVASVDWPTVIAFGAMTDDVAYFVAGDTATTVGGLYALRISDGSVDTLVEPRRGSSEGRQGILAISPSGRTLANGSCQGDHCSALVVDVTTRRSRTVPVSGWGLGFTTDDAVISNDANHLFAEAIPSGRQLWAINDIRVVRGYITTDGTRLVVQTGCELDVLPGCPQGQPPDQQLSERASRPGLSVIDLASGALRELVEPGSDVPHDLWADVSSDRVAALLRHPIQSAVLGRVPLSVSTVDLASGKLTEDAVVLASDDEAMAFETVSRFERAVFEGDASGAWALLSDYSRQGPGGSDPFARWKAIVEEERRGHWAPALLQPPTQDWTVLHDAYSGAIEDDIKAVADASRGWVVWVLHPDVGAVSAGSEGLLVAPLRDGSGWRIWLVH